MPPTSARVHGAGTLLCSGCVCGTAPEHGAGAAAGERAAGGQRNRGRDPSGRGRHPMAQVCMAPASVVGPGTALSVSGAQGSHVSEHGIHASGVSVMASQGSGVRNKVQHHVRGSRCRVRGCATRCNTTCGVAAAACVVAGALVPTCCSLPFS